VESADSGGRGRRRSRARRWAVGLPAVLFLLVAGTSPSVQAQEWPLSGAEQVDWSRSTTHAELEAFLEEVEGLSDRVQVREIGVTPQGRSIPAVFLGDPPQLVPDRRTPDGTNEKVTLLFLGAIHGNERSGKEGGLQFIRELALGDGQDILESLNVIVVPHLNPDGGAVGRRENAQGYDLNRDWIVAESPEVSAVLEELVIPFRPEVFVDVHNGGSLPYHLTYQATLDPSADPDLVAYARGPMYEAVRLHLEGEGLRMFWYSGPSFDEGHDTWYWRTTEPLPRKQHSYGGLQDMITLLFEIPGGHPLELGAAAAREGMLALTRFVEDQAGEVRKQVEQARRRTIEEPPVSVHLELEPVARPGLEPFYVMESGPGPFEESTLVIGENRTLYVPLRSRPTPWGYALGEELAPVLELLARHGVESELLEAPLTVDAEGYAFRSVSRAEAPYQNRRLLSVEVELAPGPVTLPAGTRVVRTRQPGGRLIPQLLEPDAIDSVVRWNFLDALLLDDLPEGDDGTAEVIPLFRIPSPPEGLTGP